MNFIKPIILLTLAGFALRLHYLTHSHPFFDEYTTVLAARQIWQYGWPMLPSGLFYEHGLLATYLIAPFGALFLNTPVDQWQTAHWGLFLARWPSVLVSTATIPLIYAVAQRVGQASCLSTNNKQDICPTSALFAAALFAFSPEGMVWGSRARMYALATMFALLTFYLAYRSLSQPTTRWLTLFVLGLTLFTHFGTLMLIPPLGAAFVLMKIFKPYRFLETYKVLLAQAFILALIIIAAIFVKRLGQPLGKAPLDSPARDNLPTELLDTVTYQTTFHFSWQDTRQFLARQFGVPHFYWLSLATLSGLLIWLGQTMWGFKPPKVAPFSLFLGLVCGLLILESVTMLASFRQNPRYLVMYLPLFYLLAAQAITYQLSFIKKIVGQASCLSYLDRQDACPTLVSLGIMVLFVGTNLSDLQLALITPEPAYEKALAYVRAHWQPNDAILTMNTPAAALYLGQVDGFAVETDADQFLLKPKDKLPTDRWLGAPWIGNVSDFNKFLNTHSQVWFVSDTIRQPVYYRGSWQAVINSQMDLVWAKDNALVYRTRPQRVPLPDKPDILLQANFNNIINLTGYTWHITNQKLYLTLFWQSRASTPIDYTIFVHLRNRNGATVAQRDSLPLDGTYPTTHWQAGETIIDPITLPLPNDLPAGQYTALIGLYQLATLERLPLINDTSGENGLILPITLVR